MLWARDVWGTLPLLHGFVNRQPFESKNPCDKAILAARVPDFWFLVLGFWFYRSW
jgi:hypothetical protein